MEMVIGGKKITAVVTTAMMCVLDRYKFGLQFFYEDLQIETGIPEKVLFSFSRDSRLSAPHCSLTRLLSSFFLQDLKSTLFSLISRMPGDSFFESAFFPPNEPTQPCLARIPDWTPHKASSWQDN